MRLAGSRASCFILDCFSTTHQIDTLHSFYTNPIYQFDVCINELFYYVMFVYK